MWNAPGTASVALAVAADAGELLAAEAVRGRRNQRKRLMMVKREKIRVRKVNTELTII